MDYLVEITSTFVTETGEDGMTVSCPAMYRYTPERRLIRYDEFTDEGECMHTRVVSTSNGVEIIREGNRALGLHLQLGKSFSQNYEVGYGTFLLEYQAQSIDDRLTAEGGTLIVSYRIEIGGAPSLNTVVMKVKKTGDCGDK